MQSINLCFSCFPLTVKKIYKRAWSNFPDKRSNAGCRMRRLIYKWSQLTLKAITTVAFHPTPPRKAKKLRNFT